MAAILPLDTSQPWIFNGVTYEYDSTEDRWYVISTTATDDVVETINELKSEVRTLDETVDIELENRDTLIEAGADKNNSQDAALAALEQRVDAIGQVVGALEFKGLFKYVLEHTQEACDAAYGQCVLAAEDADDPIDARQQCSRLYTDCTANVGQPYEDGSFSSKGATNVMDLVDEFVFAGTDLNGQSFDWINVVEPEDYIEFVEQNNGDTALYECIEEPKIYSTERSVRVKFLKQTGTGDGNFNLQETYEVRVIKASQGIDIIEADERYVLKPYSVIFQNTAPTTGNAPDGVLVNGEMWYDTNHLELFVWNNNAWTASAKPPSQDIVVQGVLGDVDQLQRDQNQISMRINSLVSDLLLEPNIYYSDNAPTGDITGTLRNGDLWVDSDDLSIKFYSGGAWVNPDRQVGGDYLEKSGGTMTGPLNILDPTENTHPVSRGYANTTYLRDGFQTNKTTNFRTGGTTEYPYKITNLTGGATLFKVDASAGKGGPVIFKSDNDCYQEYTVGGIVTARYELEKYTLYGTGNVSYIGETTHDFTGKVNFIRVGDEKQGFKVQGRKTDGTVGDLLYVYHNGGSVADAVNYTGKIASSNNIVNKQYVDDTVAGGKWEWHSTSTGGSSSYTPKAVYWTNIDTTTIKLNISQESLTGTSWNYPDQAHTTIELPISITAIASGGSTIPILCGKTSSIRSLTYSGKKYFQVYVPLNTQLIWNPTAVNNLSSVKVQIHGYL